ncbi:TPA: hypothetical protein P0E13_005065 [Vibrio harveyi]|nr:hypothetical protein [Vibrio harveyi]
MKTVVTMTQLELVQLMEKKLSQDIGMVVTVEIVEEEADEVLVATSRDHPLFK